MRQRSRVFALFAPLALLAAAAPLEAQSGRYEARPGAVLASGGFAGVADELLQIEGSLELDITSLPIPGSEPVVRFGSSDLRLHPVSTRILGPGPFPPPGGPSMADLEAEPRPGGGWTFTSPPSFPDDEVSLELIPTGDGEFLLRGTWTEPCCDRFAFELLGVIFDFSGPGGDPALHLAKRFAVVVRWEDHAGGTGSGTPVKLDDRSGRFWFFDPRNPELLVKVIDGCETFGRLWFFVAGLTDVGVEIRVDDLVLAGPTKTYSQPRGEPFEPILDTDAFACALL